MITASHISVASAINVFVLCYFAVAILAVYGSMILMAVTHVIDGIRHAHAERVTFDPPVLVIQPVHVYSNGDRFYQYDVWPVKEPATFEEVTARHQ
jgi:hypothetical protein